MSVQKNTRKRTDGERSGLATGSAKRTRPSCPICNRYADRERDVKGKIYVACYGCGYDSRYSALTLNP